jgi:hypothetical protein
MEFYLYLIKHHAMMTYRGAEVYLYEFLISEEEKYEWSTTPPGRFISGERVPRYLKLSIKTKQNSKFI